MRRNFLRGRLKFPYNRQTSQTSFAFAKIAWFCFTFFQGLGAGPGTVASPLGTLAHLSIVEVRTVSAFPKLLALPSLEGLQ